MHITCPECGFGRDVPEDRLPPSAEMATCPKCRHKFRFRTLGQPAFTLEDGPEDGSTDGSTDTTRAPDDVEHAAMRDETAPEEADAEAPPSDLPPEPSSEDIWQRLETMGRARRESFDQHQPPPADEHGEEDAPAPEEEAPYAHADQDATYDVPWERLDEHGFYGGFGETVKRVMLAAPTFFRHMPLGKGILRPLVFFVLVAQVQALATFIWEQMGLPTFPFMGADSVAADAAALGHNLAYVLFLGPVLAVLFLYMGVVINHLFLMLFQAASSGFEGTFRAASYSGAPQLLGIIPFVGPILGAAWSLVCTVIAYRNVHRTTYPRVIASLFAPIILTMLVVLFAASQQSL